MRLASNENETRFEINYWDAAGRRALSRGEANEQLYLLSPVYYHTVNLLFGALALAVHNWRKRVEAR